MSQPASSVVLALPSLRPRLRLLPLTIKEAEPFVLAHHRHSTPRRSGRFAVQAQLDGRRVGVAVCGRPSAGALDNGTRIEILRVCTDGTRNACSFLYGACCRIAKAMGYVLVLTYTLVGESGASLRAAGFTRVAYVKPDDGNRPSRPRKPRENPPARWRWEKEL